VYRVRRAQAVDAGGWLRTRERVVREERVAHSKGAVIQFLAGCEPGSIRHGPDTVTRSPPQDPDVDQR